MLNEQTLWLARSTQIAHQLMARSGDRWMDFSRDLPRGGQTPGPMIVGRLVAAAGELADELDPRHPEREINIPRIAQARRDLSRTTKGLTSSTRGAFGALWGGISVVFEAASVIAPSAGDRFPPLQTNLLAVAIRNADKAHVDMSCKPAGLDLADSAWLILHRLLVDGLPLQQAWEAAILLDHSEPT